MLRRVLPTVAVIVSLVLGTASTLAGNQHNACENDHHACATVLVVPRCCCGSLSTKGDDATAPVARGDSDGASSLTLVVTAQVVVNLDALLRTALMRTGDPPSIEPDRSILFSVLRL